VFGKKVTEEGAEKRERERENISNWKEKAEKEL
jgi:hypothetical protein